MRRLGVCLVALCVPASLAGAQSAVTSDTYRPSPGSGRVALIDSVVTAPPVAPAFGEQPPDVAALLDPTGATFSPRPVFAVRPESPDVVVLSRRAAGLVPAPGAAGLLALACVCAPRRRAR